MTTTATTVDIRYVARDTALYHRYDGRTGHQPVYVQLDLGDGELFADYNAEIDSNAVPASVFHRRSLRWDIPALAMAAANQLLDDIAPLAERVLAGATIEWDGNNHVGRLDDDATAAVDEIATLCDPSQWEQDSCVIGVDEYDYFTDSVPVEAARIELTARTTDDEITQMTEKIEAEIAAGYDAGAVVAFGVMPWLFAARRELRETYLYDLDDESRRMDDARARRDALITELAGWGFSYRKIAQHTNVSHVSVGQIVSAATRRAARQAGEQAEGQPSA